ncbi:MAG: pentapeptide repeat-containing protein [Proteobacteria bacterium]|nr:pentapeptide repeat-containing protein [Pseudomonadota bacterium]MBU1596694.1 pentapeptide repeat-containing protein [Pseudomonadota bacterium]
MGCCRCEHWWVKWAEPQPVVFADPSDGQEYCVFHAPEGEKRKALGSEERYTVEEFNDLVFARIDAVIERVQAGETDARCDLSRTVFPGAVDFERYGKDNPLPAIEFLGATFSGAALFGGATFSGAAWFSGATFSGAARFGGATFSGDAWFRGATFSGAAWFSEATFRGAAVFRWATFSGAAVFRWATFSGNAVFDSATFSGVAGFNRATFSGVASFERTTFSYKADFRWAGTEKDGRVVLRDMHAASLEQLVFTRAELEAPLFRFVNCDWPRRLGLEVYGKGDAAGLLECEHLYRAMRKRADDEHDRRMVSVWHDREKLMALLRLRGFGPVRAVRQLWRGARERKDGPQSETWEANKPLLALAALLPLVPLRALFSLSFWYWATCGFGERMGRAGLVLALLAVLPFLAFGPAGAALLPKFQAAANATAAPGSPGGFFAATNATAAMQFIPFTKDIGGEGWLKVAQGLWHVLVIVQATLFALAVRNRFRR